jgi:hypothetical protein
MMAKGLFLLAFALAPLASAEPVKLLPGPFELPDRIGPMRLDGEPHRYEDPRLGSSYQYSGGGLSFTLYVYDLGVRDIPDGGNTRLSCEAFEGAKADVERAGYSDVRLKSEQLARLDPAAETPLAREAIFEYTRANQPQVSYIWLTSAGKVFVKARFSMDAKLRDEMPEARRTILNALGEAVKPHLLPVPAPAPALASDEAVNKSHISVVLGGDAVDDMFLGMLYLGTVSALAEKAPELQPVCGGPVALHFEGEVGAYQAALTFSGGDTGGSKFAKRLQEIAKAGYLEEFVWTFRHRDSWGDTPPEALELAAFDEWRKKKLKRFVVPEFGRVEFEAPRPLPLEPADPAPAR